MWSRRRTVVAWPRVRGRDGLARAFMDARHLATVRIPIDGVRHPAAVRQQIDRLRDDPLFDGRRIPTMLQDVRFGCPFPDVHAPAESRRCGMRAPQHKAAEKPHQSPEVSNSADILSGHARPLSVFETAAGSVFVKTSVPAPYCCNKQKRLSYVRKFLCKKEISNGNCKRQSKDLITNLVPTYYPSKTYAN